MRREKRETALTRYKISSYIYRLINKLDPRFYTSRIIIKSSLFFMWKLSFSFRLKKETLKTKIDGPSFPLSPRSSPAVLSDTSTQ